MLCRDGSPPTGQGVRRLLFFWMVHVLAFPDYTLAEVLNAPRPHLAFQFVRSIMCAKGSASRSACPSRGVGWLILTTWIGQLNWRTLHFPCARCIPPLGVMDLVGSSVRKQCTLTASLSFRIRIRGLRQLSPMSLGVPPWSVTPTLSAWYCSWQARSWEKLEKGEHADQPLGTGDDGVPLR